MNEQANYVFERIDWKMLWQNTNPDIRLPNFYPDPIDWFGLSDYYNPIHPFPFSDGTKTNYKRVFEHRKKYREELIQKACDPDDKKYLLEYYYNNDIKLFWQIRKIEPKERKLWE
jgi:hypothetical protein